MRLSNSPLMILIFLNSKLYVAIKNLSKYKITGKSLGWLTHIG